MPFTHPRLLFLCALVVLVSIRLAPIVAADFPLGAGGLFAVMANDLRDSRFTLPAFTTYNDGTIPFVYPPLGIYLLALLPGDPIDTERWLPVLYSLVAVGAAWLLARELVGSRLASVALLAFVAMPVTWGIEGGGVTRGLGFVLLLMALWRVAVMLRAPSLPNALVAGGFAGAALLSHPSVGPPGAASALLLLAAYPSLRGVRLLGVAAAVAALVIAPWLVAVIAQHGPEPLIRASASHEQAPAVVRLLTFGPSRLGSLDPVLPAALVGIAIALRTGAWIIPAWLLVLFLVPGGEGRYAALAWAILAAYTGTLVFGALRSIDAHRLAASATFSLLLVASLIASYELFRPVPAAVRADMVNGPTVPSRADDPAVEWYPALTGLPHPAGYFGYEWTDSWDERLHRYNVLLRRH